jgi:hypothetical protein
MNRQTGGEWSGQKKGRLAGGPVNLQETQLFSLLARFQLISSPIVELVLETGCL